MTVAELMKALGTRKGKAKILLHLSDQNGRIVEGVLSDQAPEFGVGSDSLNVVHLYGMETHPHTCQQLLTWPWSKARSCS
jgi:hypothetical protein